jgi:UDP-N-acetylglucosamine acyltransferase
VDEWAILGGGSMAHQFSHIGAHAMVGGGSLIHKDVPPYALAGREPLVYAGINVVGLRRRGFSNEQIETIKDIYRVIYFDKLNRSDACDKVEATFPQSVERDTILNFIRGSKRGIIKAMTSDASAE